MSDLQIGLLGIALLLALLMASMPVAFAMMVVGVAGFAVLRGDAGAAMAMAANDLYSTFSDYNLTVIPLFVFMGQIAFHAGISRRLFVAPTCWLGRACPAAWPWPRWGPAPPSAPSAARARPPPPPWRRWRCRK
jgi:C4-dicarboxylate transporter, DctM subunit